MEPSEDQPSPDAPLEHREWSLRDALAIDRTLLANERTLLAYLRSGVALAIAGVSIMHFADRDWFWAVGAGCIPWSLLTLLIGIRRYRRMQRSIAAVRGRGGAGPGMQR